MNFSDLQIFVDVVRRGSFTAVAAERQIAPSSVSRSIATLEEQLGIRLFQRTTRHLALTEAGAIYHHQISPLLEEIEHAKLLALDSNQKSKGILRITASVSFGQMCIVPILPQFALEQPDVTVDLLLTDTVVDVVMERIDLAIRLGPLSDSTLIAQRLIETEYIVCASPGYLKRQGRPLNPRDLHDHNCLLFPLPGYRSRWIFQRRTGGKPFEIPVQGKQIISNAMALQQAATLSLGIALLPSWLIKNHLKAGRLINIFSDYRITATEFGTSAWLVYPSRDYVPRKVRSFADLLKQHMQTES